MEVSEIDISLAQVQIEMIAVERNTLERSNRTDKASEEIIQKMDKEPDPEETRLKMEIY